MGKELGKFVELDLTSFEDASTNGFKLIREDKLLSGGLSLDLINEEFSEIHKAISHTPIARRMPSLTKLPFIGGMFKENVSVKLQGFEGKLSSIFIAYEENYTSLVKSGELYDSNIKSLTGKIASLVEHIETVPAVTDDNKLYIHKVKDLISALTGTRARMIINLDTAKEIRIQMKLNKPIFKTIIDALVFEKAGEIGLRAAQNSIDVMNNFIVKSSNELTDSTIQFSKEINANKYNTLNSDAFNNNLKKLSDAIKDIAEIKQKAVLEFDKAMKAPMFLYLPGALNEVSEINTPPYLNPNTNN